ncbi:MAG: IS66 family transposase, partial [Promethearchaeota archaeon]
MVSILVWSFKKCRRNSRRREKADSHGGLENEQNTRNTQSIERTRQPKPEERRLQALEAKVRYLESQLEEKEKENLKLKKQVLKHEKKNRVRKENIRKYQEKNKAVRKATAGKKIDGAGKRTGKPPGCAGSGFKLPPGKPDVENDWILDRCPLYGTGLKGNKSISTWNHTIIDLVPPKGYGGHGLVLEVIRHRIHRYRCPGCKKLVYKDFGPLKNAHYGVGMIAFVMAERIENRAPWSRVTKTLRCVLRGDALIPTIAAFIQWMQRYEPEVRQMYEAIRTSIKESAFAHVDETGIPKDGANWWMWVVVTGHVVLFLQDASRGHQVIKDIFDGYKGILLSDFWTA